MAPAPLTVILVHGTWHDERCWREVRNHLVARGIPALTVTMPSTNPPTDDAGAPLRLPGFEHDIAAVSALVEATAGPIMLCGHAYGGMVISEVGAHERVVKLVYLAAFCPEPGESARSLAGRIVGPAPFSRRAAVDGLSVVSPRTASWLLYNDLSRPVRSRRLAELQPSSALVLRARAVRSAWLSTPATYVICRRDRALGHSRQRRMAYRLIRAQLANSWYGEHATTLDTGHCPFYSAPAAVADVLQALMEQ